MAVLHRLWTGFVAAVAGAAVAIPVQIAGQMGFGLPLGALVWTVAAFAGLGFLVGVAVGPRGGTRPPDGSTRDHHAERGAGG